jgi:hypothetical protein
MATTDHNQYFDHPELKRLRLAMSDKWIPPERFVRFVDMDGNGFMDYEEFYDLTQQFGLHCVIDVDETFAVLDYEESGLVPISVFEAALTPTEEDSFFVSADEQSPDLQMENFPTGIFCVHDCMFANNLSSALFHSQKKNDNAPFCPTWNSPWTRRRLL